MARCTLCAIAIACIVALAHSVSAQNNTNGQMVISINVCEKTADGSKPRILAEPTIATVPGRAFSFVSGGSVKTRAVGDELDIGTRVTGKLKRTPTGTVQLALKVSVGFAVSQDDDPETDLVKTETLDIRTVVRAGETKRFKCSATHWCDVRVDPVK